MASKPGAGNIKVGVRLRPMIAREENEFQRWKMQGNRISRFDQESSRATNTMEFDHVFGDQVKNDDIFKTLVEPLVQKAVKGFNATILAYGQTSSGKTHTMMGSDNDRGIVPLTMKYIFDAIDNVNENRNFLLGVSFMEVYNEKVRDLLNIEKSDLKVYETVEGNIATDCTVDMVSSPDEMVQLMDQGNKNKSIGETQMNERSSRSHTIFRITIESQEQGVEGGVARVSQINLVDLAGSERASQTGTTGQRYKEGCAINKSLLQLGNVVQKLSEDKGEFIDYRSSKLTRILQPSLSGNANIVMICNVTPYSAEQTANTLLFASRASTIKLDPHLNEIMDDATLLKRHAKRIKELEKDIKDAGFLKERNQDLEKEVEKLRNMLIFSRLPKLPSDNQRAPRRRTWGGPALENAVETKEMDLRIASDGRDVNLLMPPMQLAPRSLEQERKTSMPETITLRNDGNDDFNASVHMSFDEAEGIPEFLIVPSGDVTPPSKLRSEIINLRQQLAVKAAATPVLRQQISILEKQKEERDEEYEGVKSLLLSKKQLEDEAKPSTPVPKLRERIKNLEEELENEHSKNQTETTKLIENLHKVEEELQAQSEALQQKSKEYEQLLKERANTVDTPGTPAAALHDRIKLLQEQSSQLAGTPPAQLRKKIFCLEEECKCVETELSELREFTTLEKQMIAEGKVEELQEENISMKKTVRDYEQICTDLRKHNSELLLQNEELNVELAEKDNCVQSMTKELETNKAWNSKANEQQLVWKKELNQCREQLAEMKNKSLDWIEEKEIMKSRYESKIKELTSSLQEAWSSESSCSSSRTSNNDNQADGSQQIIQDMQKKIDDLQSSLSEFETQKEEKAAVADGLNVSCQTDHDMEQFGHHQAALKELRDRLDETEEKLAILTQKEIVETGCQTDHDNAHPADTSNVMLELEDVIDEKNKLASKLESLTNDYEELKQNTKLIMFEHEGLQAQIEDMKQITEQEAKAAQEKLEMLQMNVKQKEEEIILLTSKCQESEKACEVVKDKLDAFTSKNNELSEKISQLEGSMDSQEEIKERMFFVSQENDNMKTQLEYKQEALNFNLTEIERLKSELSQAKNCTSQKTGMLFIKQEPADFEDLAHKLENRNQELELQIAGYEATIEDLRQAPEQNLISEKIGVFEFQHDSMTIMTSSEKEEQLRQEIVQLKAQLTALKVEKLEQTRDNLCQVNNGMEEKLSEVLDQISQQGLLPELASQTSSPSPQIDNFISQQLELLQSNNEELAIINEDLKTRLTNFQEKNTELAHLLEKIDPTVQDNVKEFIELLKMQVLEISGKSAASTNLKDLHSELLGAFMIRSEEVCTDLRKQIKSLQGERATFLQKINEQTEIANSLKAANDQLQEATDNSKLTEEIAFYKSKVHDYEMDIRQLESEVEEYRKALTELQSKSDISNDDSMTTTNGKVLEIALKLNQAEDCLEMTINEERQLRTKLAEKEAELLDLIEQKGKLEEEKQGLHVIIEETIKFAEMSKERCSVLEVELSSTKEKMIELEHAIDVTEKANEADKQKIQKLTQEFEKCKLALEETEDLEIKTSEQLMDKLSEIENLTKTEAELRRRIVELEESSSSSEKLVELRARFEEYQPLAAEVVELRSNLKDFEELKAKSEELPIVLAQFEELKKSRAVEVEELSNKVIDLELYRDRAGEVDNLKSSIVKLEEILNDKQAELEDFKNRAVQLDDLREKLVESEQLKSKFEEELQHLSAVRENNPEEAESLKNTIFELEIALDEANKNIEARKQYATNLEQELARAKEAPSFLDRSANTTTDLQLTLDGKNIEQILALESLNSNLKSELRNITDDFESITSEKSALEEKVTELEAELESLKEKATSLKNQLVMLSTKDAKNQEAVSTLKSEVTLIKEANDKLQVELETCNEALCKEQELAKFLRVDAKTQMEARHFSLQGEVQTLKDQLTSTEKTLQQIQIENENLKHIFDQRTEELAQLETKYSQLAKEKENCWQELQDARQNLEMSEKDKLALENNLEMYKSNLESMRFSVDSANSELNNQLEKMQDDLIKMNNEKYEVELQMQAKVELIGDLEVKITNTNTILNRVSGERDVLTNRLAEAKKNLDEVSVQRDELSDKCREVDNDYEELLVVYREVETKSKNFQTQAIKLREEKEELASRLKNIENQVGALGPVDHSLCQQNVKELEAKLTEKSNELFVMKKDLSYTKGELMHRKLQSTNQPGIFDDPEVYKDKIKDLERKIVRLNEEIMSLTAKVEYHKNDTRDSKVFCKNCVPKFGALEAGVQAVPNSREVSVQAPPDNNVLFDTVQGFTPASAITEAARMFGMRQQIAELTTKIEELTNDRKLFKDVLRKRLLTIRTLEAQVSAMNAKNPGQENKGIPLTDKN